MNNPFDPVASSNAAAQLTQTNEKSLTNALGRTPTDGEMYLAHQQGAVGAGKILSHPDATMGSLGLGRAASGNGGTPDTLARDFASKWVGQVDGIPKAPAPAAPAGSPMALPGASQAPGGLDLNGPSQGASNSPAGLPDGGQGASDPGLGLSSLLPRLAFGFAPLQPMGIAP